MLPIKKKRNSIIDRHSTISAFSFCIYCKNLVSMTDGECKGFTTFIPDDIWKGNNDHTQPYRGDNGIMYEPSEG